MCCTRKLVLGSPLAAVFWSFCGEYGGVPRLLGALYFIYMFHFFRLCFVRCWHIEQYRTAVPYRLPVNDAVLLYGAAAWFTAWHGVQYGRK